MRKWRGLYTFALIQGDSLAFWANTPSSQRTVQPRHPPPRAALIPLSKRGAYYFHERKVPPFVRSLHPSVCVLPSIFSFLPSLFSSFFFFHTLFSLQQSLPCLAATHFLDSFRIIEDADVRRMLSVELAKFLVLVYAFVFALLPLSLSLSLERKRKRKVSSRWLHSIPRPGSKESTDWIKASFHPDGR